MSVSRFLVSALVAASALSSTLALAQLELEPIIDLGMRLGEGSGAAVALPVLRAAIATLAEMATFDDAGVSGRSEP